MTKARARDNTRGTLESGAVTCGIVVSATDAPQWVQLFPKGPSINARDGRKFTMNEPAKVVAAFADNQADLPIDWNHANDIVAPQGGDAPAAGWISAIEVRDDGLYGLVNWTAKGAASVTSREYRYLSPSFYHDKAGEITQVVGAGLVNSPALKLQALAREEQNPESVIMDKAKLIQMLGLKADASEAEIAAAVTANAGGQAALQTQLTESAAKLDGVTAELAAIKKKPADQPTLDKFVPRADYEAVLARATTLEKTAADTAKAAKDAEIETLVTAAVKAGKITPATVDFYKSACRAEGGIESFKKFVGDAATITPPSGLDGKGSPPNQKQTAGDQKFTEEQEKMLAVAGMSKDQFLKYNPNFGKATA